MEDVETRLTGGVDGGRGWKGNVKLMQLDNVSIEVIRLGGQVFQR